MVAFAAVGLLSIFPTVRIISWRRKLAKNAAFAPAAGDILKVRRFLWAEVAFFALISMKGAPRCGTSPCFSWVLLSNHPHLSEPP
jgi:putative membrane protein